MSHLLREHAPITEAGWRVDRRRGAPARHSRARRPQAGRLRRTARLGVLGDQPRAHERARRRPGRRRHRRAAPRARGRRAARHRSRSRAPSCATPIEAPRTSTWPRSTRPPTASRPPRTAPCSTAGRPPDITGIADASPHDAIALGDDCELYPRHVAQAVEALLHAGIDGPFGLALGPEAYTRVLETAEHGGYPLLDHLRKIIGGPLVWAPGVDGCCRREPARRRLPVRGRRGSVDRLRPPRRRCGRALPRRELHVPGRHARGRGGARAIAAQAIQAGTPLSVPSAKRARARRSGDDRGEAGARVRDHPALRPAGMTIVSPGATAIRRPSSSIVAPPPSTSKLL